MTLNDKKKKFFTFNFACFSACLRFTEKGPQLLVVIYDDNGNYSIRLPGGCVKFEDLVLGINKVVPQMNKMTSERIPVIISRIKDWGVEYEEQIIVLDKKHKEDLENINQGSLNSEQKKLEIKNIKKEFFKTKNFIFNDKMKNSFEMIFYALEPKHLMDEIMTQVHLACLERELKDETFASPGSDFYEASSVFVGTHEKIGYVSVNTKAPDSSRGSGDSDIVGSEWMDLKSAMDQLFEASQSSHKAVLQSAIREAIEIKLENSEQLVPYLKASDK